MFIRQHKFAGCQGWLERHFRAIAVRETFVGRKAAEREREREKENERARDERNEKKKLSVFTLKAALKNSVSSLTNTV